MHAVLIQFVGCSKLFGIKLSQVKALCKIWTQKSSGSCSMCYLLSSVLHFTCSLILPIKFILSLSIPYLFLYVYVCVYAYIYVHVHGDQRLISVIFIFLDDAPSCFSYRALSGSEAWIQLGWTASPRHFPVSASPVFRLSLITGACQIWRIWT